MPQILQYQHCIYKNQDQFEHRKRQTKMGVKQAKVRLKVATKREIHSVDQKQTNKNMFLVLSPLIFAMYFFHGTSATALATAQQIFVSIDLQGYSCLVIVFTEQSTEIKLCINIKQSFFLLKHMYIISIHLYCSRADCLQKVNFLQICFFE